jgi:hypothetical protein
MRRPIKSGAGNNRMEFVRLAFRPSAFYRERAETLGWLWPILGFYLFGFATFFQGHLVPGYHIPFYAIVYIMAWFPTLIVVAGLFVLLILFWYWPASMVLGRRQSLELSVKIVGTALLPPAVAFWGVLLVLAVLNGNDVAAPYRAIVAAAHSIAALWAAALIVVGAAVSNRLTSRNATLFALWPVLLVVLLGAIAYAIVHGG